MTMNTDSDANGLAALSICEVLALVLTEQGLLTKEDICTALDDVIATLRDHETSLENLTRTSRHRCAAAITERIRDSVLAAAPDRDR